MHKFLNLFLIATIVTSCFDNSPKNETNPSQNGVSPEESVAEIKPFEIKGTEVHSLTSSLNQKSYELYVKLPKSYVESDEKYPVLILTDSDYSFPLVTSITRRLNVEEFITIGISYSRGDEATVSRTRDYTPTFSPNEPRGHSKESRLASGKADDFVAFIKNDVLPFLEKTYRVDMSKKAFAGHSFGGLLAAYILVTTPNLFEYYLAGSPSLWYDDFCIKRFEENYASAHSNLKANVFMCIGADEDTKTGSKMVAEMFDFEKRLLSRHYSDLSLKAVSIPNEDHQTVYPVFITKGILWAFGKENTAGQRQP